MRHIYKNNPRINKDVTQGTIINNCVADKYSCEIWGVIVTPRCDLAHTGKVTHVHYLPVIPFDEWYKVDGLEYLWTKALERNKKKLQAICNTKGFPTKRLNENQLIELCDSLPDSQDKSKLKDIIDNLYRLERSNPIEYNPNHDEKHRLISNLRKGELPSFYLIEDWRDRNNYMVILLRDLKRLEYSVAMQLSKGIEETSIKNQSRNDFLYSKSKELIYNSEAEIDSPYIEQLMERFSHNFCRIGVDDMNEDVENVLNSIIE